MTRVSGGGTRFAGINLSAGGREFFRGSYAAMEGPANGGLRSNGAGRAPRNPGTAVAQRHVSRISRQAEW